jgi:hypothetical protein
LRRAHLVWITVKDRAEREGAEALASALTRIPTKGREGTFLPVDVVELETGSWKDLLGHDADVPPGAPLALTSVAEPDSFVRLVEGRLGATSVPSLRFPDHHPYSSDDAGRIAREAGTRWIATTEKDAVKLSDLRELLPPVRVLPLSPRPGGSAIRALLDLVGSPGPPRRGP